MLPIATLVITMSAILILGAQEWRRKSTRMILIIITALLQTSLILFDMITMRPPHP